jgi:hypothetical protein
MRIFLLMVFHDGICCHYEKKKDKTKTICYIFSRSIHVKHLFWSRSRWSRISLRFWLHQNDAAPCDSGSATLLSWDCIEIYSSATKIAGEYC